MLFCVVDAAVGYTMVALVIQNEQSVKSKIFSIHKGGSMAQQDWVSIAEAMEIANIKHRMTIWRCCKSGEFKTARKVGNTWMIDRQEVIRYGEYYHSTEFDDENEGDEV